MRPILTLLALLAAAPFLCAGEIYVSPGGDDAATGTAEAPVATLEKAAALLPKGGTAILQPGIYRERATLTGEADAPPLRLRAAGEGVIFDGGERLAGWEPVGKNLYATPLPASVQETRANLHLWDRKRLLRLTRLADEAAVRAISGSFVLRADGTLLVHLAEGEKPEGLTCNRASKGIVIQRPRVTLEGISLRNYLFDGYSAAVAIGPVQEIGILSCQFDNVRDAVSISPGASQIEIRDCDIRFAGTAINNRGNDITLTDNVFEAASGAFAMRELLPVIHCAIRIYHPAHGFTVSGNVTKGYQYGLRIKTDVSPSEGDARVIIEHNTFADGVSLTPEVITLFRPEHRFSANILAVGAEEGALVRTLREHGATVETNYLYPADTDAPASMEPPGGRNESGAHPFPRFAEGDLEPTVELPKDAEGKPAGAARTRIAWANAAAPAKEETAPLPSLRAPKREGEAPLTLHVRPGASAEAADGSTEHPYPYLQAALDHALPGDTVLLAPGIYPHPATLTRSGKEGAPITIRGAGATATILEGARQSADLLTLRDVEHVVVKGIQFRWFREAGLRLESTAFVRVSECTFLNGGLDIRGETPTGYGIFGSRSRGLTITGCLLARNRVGIKLVKCPGVVIEQNTGFRNLNTALELVQSSKGSTLRRNSFGYSSHAAIYLWEPQPAAFRSLRCDENNYAMRLYHYLIHSGGKPPDPDVVLEVPARYGSVAGGKAIIDILDTSDATAPRTRYGRFEEWQKASGKDQHSTYADPQYADPVRGDFRLLPGSPNLLPDGTFVGAFGPLPER